MQEEEHSKIRSRGCNFCFADFLGSSATMVHLRACARNPSGCQGRWSWRLELQPDSARRGTCMSGPTTREFVAALDSRTSSHSHLSDLERISMPATQPASQFAWLCCADRSDAERQGWPACLDKIPKRRGLSLLQAAKVRLDPPT